MHPRTARIFQFSPRPAHAALLGGVRPRHVDARRGDRTGEILVNLVTTTQEEHDMSPLKEALLNLELEGKIVGFLHILNDSLSDVVQSDETRIIYGQDYFYEKLLNLEFSHCCLKM